VVPLKPYLARWSSLRSLLWFLAAKPSDIQADDAYQLQAQIVFLKSGDLERAAIVRWYPGSRSNGVERRLTVKPLRTV